MCIMLEQMSFEAEKTAFSQMEGYLFCFLFLNKVSEDKQVKSESLRNHLTGTLENVSVRLQKLPSNSFLDSQ